MIKVKVGKKKGLGGLHNNYIIVSNLVESLDFLS